MEVVIEKMKLAGQDGWVVPVAEELGGRGRKTKSSRSASPTLSLEQLAWPETVSKKDLCFVL